MAGRSSRRTFLRHVAFAGASLPLAMPPLIRAASPSGKLNLAGIGVGGKGYSDIVLSSKGHNVVALCDVDHRSSESRAGIAKAAKDFPDAALYHDYRKLLERKDVQAVTVGTPDHMHAPIAMTAMALGKHVYVEKPMAHSIHEVRQLTLAARKHKVVSQMGNQLHSSVGYRMVVQLIQQGVIGKVRQTHNWSSLPIWPIIPRPLKASHPVPAEFDWDLWLGVAPKRDYIDELYHPFNWRGWMDFGTGKQGDMGCHIFDPVVWALDLKAPTAITVEGPKPFAEQYHAWRVARYEFPATPYTTGPIKHTWYDGGMMPPIELAQMPAGRSLPSQGALFIGTEGVLVINHSPTAPQLYPEEKFKDFKLPQLEVLDHYTQFSNACVGNGHATSHFDYAGPLTETVLLGNVAMHYPGQRLEWDSANMRIPNFKEAEKHLRRPYRKGWDIPGLS